MAFTFIKNTATLAKRYNMNVCDFENRMMSLQEHVKDTIEQCSYICANDECELKNIHHDLGLWLKGKPEADFHQVKYRAIYLINKHHKVIAF
jgi:hypothetical protein